LMFIKKYFSKGRHHTFNKTVLHKYPLKSSSKISYLEEKQQKHNGGENSTVATLLLEFSWKACSCQSTSTSHIDQRSVSAFHRPIYKRPDITILPLINGDILTWSELEFFYTAAWICHFYLGSVRHRGHKFGSYFFFILCRTARVVEEPAEETTTSGK
jgi:hypothetical protein